MGRVVEPNRTPMNAREWISSLEGRVPKALWHKPIAQIDVPDLLAAVADVVAKYPDGGAGSASGWK